MKVCSFSFRNTLGGNIILFPLPPLPLIHNIHIYRWFWCMASLFSFRTEDKYKLSFYFSFLIFNDFSFYKRIKMKNCSCEYIHDFFFAVSTYVQRVYCTKSVEVNTDAKFSCEVFFLMTKITMHIISPFLFCSLILNQRYMAKT